MIDFYEYTFEDIVIKDKGFLRGPFGGSLKKEIFVTKSENTYKVYEQGVVLRKNIEIGDYYIEEDYFIDSMYRFEVKPKDFLISCSGVNYGAIFQMPEKIEKGIINQALLRIRINNKVINDNFFNYFFSHYIVNQIVGKKGDSTIPNFPPVNVLKKLKFKIPILSVQKQIAKVLSDLDAKIELNNKINRELEAMAKTLYDYWFVQFDFPNEQGKPYKSSGGKMVYNAELKREIPEGWEVKNIFKCCKVQYGFPFSTDYFNTDGNGIPVIRIRNILENSISNYSTEQTLNTKYLIKKGDLLIGMDGNFHINYWSKEGCYLNQRAVKLSETILPNIFLKYQIEPFIKLREKSVSRTTVGHLSDKDLKALNILIPSKKVLSSIISTYNSVLERMIKAKNENQQLTELRDWLLPMLMNGQVTLRQAQGNAVKEAEEKLSSSAELSRSMAAEPSVEYKTKGNE